MDNHAKKTGATRRGVAAMVAVLLMAAGAALASEDGDDDGGSVRDGVKQAGHAVGSVFREIGHGTRDFFKAIGHGLRGDGAEEDGEEARRDRAAGKDPARGAATPAARRRPEQ